MNLYENCDCGKQSPPVPADRWDVFAAAGSTVSHWPARYGGCSTEPRRASVYLDEPTQPQGLVFIEVDDGVSRYVKLVHASEAGQQKRVSIG